MCPSVPDIDRNVFSVKSKIDTTFLTDPTKKDTSGNIITTGLSANQLLILNGVPITANNTGFGKDTNPIPANYPYTNVPVTNCIFDTNGVATNQPCQTDITGNITNASGSIRNQSRDFRLFVDNTNPDRIDAFQLTPDGNPATLQNSFCDQDGLRSDGKTPERDRLSTVAQATQNQCSTTNYDGTRFVVRGNQVTLKGSFEKNQRIALKVIKKNKLTPQVEDVKYYFPEAQIPLGEGVAPAGDGVVPAPVCTLSNPSQTTDKTTKQSLITKFKDNCNYEFTYNIIDDGSQNSELDLNNYYDFSFYPIDKAGNTPIPGGVNNSISSSTLTVYHDLVKPNVATNTPECPQSSINCNSPITSINYNQPEKTTIGGNQANTWNQFDTTNQTTIEIKTIGEKQSDLQQTQTQKLNQVVPSGEGCPTGGVCPLTNYGTENKIELTPNSPLEGCPTGGVECSPNYGIRDDNNQIINDLSILKQTRILKMGDTGPYSENISSFNLGKTTTDEADNCITNSNSPIKNRRVGTCNNGDGLYTITERNIDTAGNRGGWVSRTVERDTVEPSSPTVSLSKDNNNTPISNISLQIMGEAYTDTKITLITENDTNTNHTGQLNSDGNLTLNNFAKTTCGKMNYKVTVILVDRAGNESVAVESNIIQSNDCDKCTTQDGSFVFPVNHPNAVYLEENPNFGFETTSRPDHQGIDINSGNSGVNILGAPVVAVSTATVIRIGFETGGYGNFVYLGHGDGVITRYAHLQTSASDFVKIGQKVYAGQQIGKLGSTGNSTAPHLHFEVRINGQAVNPAPYILGNNKTITCIANANSSSSINLKDFKGTIDNKWSDKKASDLGEFKLRVEMDENGNITKTENLEPVPVITFSQTNSDNTSAIIAGLGINKNANLKVEIKYKKKNCFAWIVCWTTDETRNIDEQVEHAEIVLVNNGNNQVGQLWNDNPDGKWEATINTAPGSEIRAYTKIHGTTNFDFPEKGNKTIDYGNQQTKDSNKVKIQQNNVSLLKNQIWEKHRLESVDGDKNWSEVELRWTLEALDKIKSIGLSMFSENDLQEIKRYGIARSGSSCDNTVGTPNTNILGYYSPLCKAIYITDSTIPEDDVDLKYNIQTPEINYKITLVHEITHAYQRKNGVKAKEFGDISWLNTPTGGRSFTKKPDANACDFVTGYISNSNEDMAEIYGTFIIKPEIIQQKFNLHKNGFTAYGSDQNNIDFTYFMPGCGASATYSASRLYTKFNFNK